MADKTSQSPQSPMDTLTQLQEAGMGNMMGLGTKWLEAVSDMNAEWADFVAKRIKEDVDTQHQILQCKNMSDLQHIQAQFLQKATDQYQAETGKLLEMGTKAFAQKPDKG